MSGPNHHEDLRNLARALQPTRMDEARVLAGAMERREAARPRRGMWVPIAAVAAASVALAALWVMSPSRVDRDLVAEVEPAREALGSLMEIEYLGRGAASGPSGDVDIRWDEGRLLAEVEPGRQARLLVRTPEAEVRVVGTVFAVDRQAIGTSVEVSEGEVAVTCLHEAEVVLGAGEDRTCYRSLAAALGDLRGRSGTPGELVATIDRVLAMPGGALAARAELEVLRVSALYESGQAEEALGAAEAYLATGVRLRRVEVLGLASRLAHEQGGCARSRPWLETWYAEGHALPVPALVELADCTAEDGARARRILEEALAREPEGPNAEAIRDRLGRL